MPAWQNLVMLCWIKTCNLKPLRFYYPHACSHVLACVPTHVQCLYQCSFICYYLAHKFTHLIKYLLITWLFTSLFILSYPTLLPIIHGNIAVLSNTAAELWVHHPCCQSSYRKGLALGVLEHGYLETGCLKRHSMKWTELVPNPIKRWHSDRLTKETVARNLEKTSSSKPQKEDSGDISPVASSSQTLSLLFPVRK